MGIDSIRSIDGNSDGVGGLTSGLTVRGTGREERRFHGFKVRVGEVHDLRHGKDGHHLVLPGGGTGGSERDCAGDFSCRGRQDGVLGCGGVHLLTWGAQMVTGGVKDPCPSHGLDSRDRERVGPRGIGRPGRVAGIIDRHSVHTPDDDADVAVVSIRHGGAQTVVIHLQQIIRRYIEKAIVIYVTHDPIYHDIDRSALGAGWDGDNDLGCRPACEAGRLYGRERAGC